jgi:hypothetical protein
MIEPSSHVPAAVAPAVRVTVSRKKDWSVATPSHSGAKVQVWSVPSAKFSGAKSSNGESLVAQAPPIDTGSPNQSKLAATTMPPPTMYASRLSPSVVPSRYSQLEKAITMSYCCNSARVGVSKEASKKSAATMPGSANRLASKVASGSPQSADTTSTR